MNQNAQDKRVARPPIVVVLGHIDHGKTTLLDYIRKTEVVAGESGGITQHIGAYQVVHNEKQITFLDTPGHEAFSQMRSRGARVADVAIVVVAADDGVKPQTKEALVAVKDAGIPFIIGINKIDKAGADPDRVKNDLASVDVLVEGRGGTVPVVEFSAKEGRGVNDVLDTIVLLAELEEISADPSAHAQGVVIESHRDAKRGNTATLLVHNGTLKKGEFVTAGTTVTKVRILEDYKNDSIDAAGPSVPVVVVGFDAVPTVGAEFQSFSEQKEAMEHIEKIPTPQQDLGASISSTDSNESVSAGKLPQIGVIIKADTEGSAEAIVHEIEKLRRDSYVLKILRAAAGEVGEDDVKLVGSATEGIIVAFKVNITSGAKEWGERLGVTIAAFDIIYEIFDFLKNKIENMLPAQINRVVTGKAKILKIFGAQGKAQIIGGRVSEGSIETGMSFSLLRRGKAIAEGKVHNLQTGKTNVGEATKGKEFGAKVNTSATIAPGDELETAREEKIKQTL